MHCEEIFSSLRSIDRNRAAICNSFLRSHWCAERISLCQLRTDRWTCNRADATKAQSPGVSYREKTNNSIQKDSWGKKMWTAFRTAKLHEFEVRSKSNPKCCAVRCGEKVRPPHLWGGALFRSTNGASSDVRDRIESFCAPRKTFLNFSDRMLRQNLWSKFWRVPDRIETSDRIEQWSNWKHPKCFLNNCFSSRCHHLTNVLAARS
jgi:hypothetical protein